MKQFIRSLGFLMILCMVQESVVAKESVTISKDGDVSISAEGSATKLGVLDWQRLVSTAPQAKEAAKRLEAEFQGPSQKLNDKQSDFQAKRTKLQRDRDVLSVTERAKKEKELAKLEQEIRRLDEELRAETTTRHREEMDDFLRVVREVVEKFGQEKQYDAIFSQEVMAYFSDRVDITDQILDRLQKLPKPAEKKS